MPRDTSGAPQAATICVNIQSVAHQLARGFSGIEPMSDTQTVRLLGTITRDTGRLLTSFGQQESR